VTRLSRAATIANTSALVNHEIARRIGSEGERDFCMLDLRRSLRP
jgi:hypothetical protein